jgi:hypothetical protein
MNQILVFFKITSGPNTVVYYEAAVPQYVLFPMLMKGKFTNKIHGRVELKQ